MGTIPFDAPCLSVPSTAPHASRRLWCVQLLPRGLNPFAELAIALQLTLHLVHTVNHRRVIAPAERLADLDELHLQHLAREVHGDLARHGERLDARLGAQALRRDAPAARDDILHLVDGRARLGLRAGALLAGADLVGQGLAGEVDGDLPVPERGVEQALDDAALELPDVALDVLGDKAEELVRDGG